VTLDGALELLRQEKPSRRTASRRVLRELGRHPVSGVTVQLLEGRYGPYVTDGTTNASLPKQTSADEVTLDAAVELLRAREGAKPSGRGRTGAAARGGGSRRSRAGGAAARKRQA
jgi:DNA topoisomerase-1